MIINCFQFKLIMITLLIIILGGYNINSNNDNNNNSMVDAYNNCNANYLRITRIDNNINRFHNNYQYKINHNDYNNNNNNNYNNKYNHNIYMMSDSSFMSFGNHMTIDIKLPTREKRVAIDFLKSPKKILGINYKSNYLYIIILILFFILSLTK